MKKISFGSLCVHETRSHKTTKPHILPIYATSSFAFDEVEHQMDVFKNPRSAHVYGRYGNPTIEAVAEKIAKLESHGLDFDVSAIMVSSGMAAISTLLMANLKSGDKVLTQGNLYGGTTEFLLKILGPMGIETIMTDLRQLDKVEDILQSESNIKALYFETPANPNMACVDIEALASVAKKYDCLSMIDNTFCTPYLQQPFALGVDFVLHSTTKFLNGHGNSIAGIILGKDPELMHNKVWQTMKLAGTNCNPFDAWLTHNGLKTLELRMDRHSNNGQAVAEFLEAHPAVSRVNYNGLPSHEDHEVAKKQMRAFGGMLSFELKDGFDAAVKFMSALQFCTMAPTLGDVDTLILHPASSSHINVDKGLREANGITDGLVRMSVGIENVEDIIGDLELGL